VIENADELGFRFWNNLSSIRSIHDEEHIRRLPGLGDVDKTLLKHLQDSGNGLAQSKAVSRWCVYVYVCEHVARVKAL